jgi:rubrerythrin
MDVLKFAIDMELEGEKYYREQAGKNSKNGLGAVFTALADDERGHAKLLTDKAKGLSYEAKASGKSPAQNVFDGLGDFKLDTKSNPEQADLYWMALEKEKQSIELYRDLLSKSETDKGLYEFLIAQEEAHYKIMEDIARMVNRPNEWVESAEFGVREEY